MAKPEWGTKRTCPKCSTRFYDLGNEDPCTCLDCGTRWIPEPILKTKQSHVIQPKPAAKKEKKSTEETDQDALLADDTNDIEVPDEEGETVLGNVSLDDSEDDAAVVLDTSAAVNTDE